MGGFRSGVIVGVITGSLSGLTLLAMGYLMSHTRPEELCYVIGADLSIILGSVLATGYCGIFGGLVVGFSVGLYYSARGYRLAQTNLDVMYFSLFCTIFFFGLIEVHILKDWLPFRNAMMSGGFWATTLILAFVSYILFRLIRWTLHSIFLVRLGFMLFYRWTLYLAIAILALLSVIYLINQT